MTNYNERLDEILNSFKLYLTLTGNAIGGSSQDEAKQAIASLNKELVAEAKPKKKSTEDYGSWEEGHRNVGWNNCLEDYEQNLLKALEEV